MVNLKRSKSHESRVYEITFYGADADRIYFLLKRLYTRMKGVNVDLFEDIPDGTLVFADELAVLRKLFQ